MPSIIGNKYGSYKTVVSHSSPVSSATDIKGSISFGVSNTLSFSSSFSSSVTNSAITSGVGGSLGIGINKTVNKTASAVLKLKKGQSRRIDAHPVCKAYKGFVQRKYITDTGGLSG